MLEESFHSLFVLCLSLSYFLAPIKAESVVSEIRACGNLCTLCLSGNTIGVEAARAIAGAIKEKPSLKVSASYMIKHTLCNFHLVAKAALSLSVIWLEVLFSQVISLTNCEYVHNVLLTRNFTSFSSHHLSSNGFGTARGSWDNSLLK